MNPSLSHGSQSTAPLPPHTVHPFTPTGRGTLFGAFADGTRRRARLGGSSHSRTVRVRARMRGWLGSAGVMMNALML